jgi:peptide/nickel transport system permease protein
MSGVLRLTFSRLLQAGLVLLLMSYLVYALIGLMPGDPVDLMISADPNLTSADAQRLKAQYGLDQPLSQRWGSWLAAAADGELGYSRLYARPVMEVLLPALGTTLKLMGLALGVALLVAFAGALLAASRPNSPRDLLVNLAAFAGISMPPFWLALLLIAAFAVWLGLLPAGGSGQLADASGAWWRYALLPVATLAIASAGTYVRYLRGSLLDALRQDYIRTARAKGASEPRVLLVHALRNAAMPLITILGLELGALFSGALVTETIFAWPGMGRLIYEAIMGNDFNLALVGLLLATAVTLAGSLFADLLYLWLDPRIRYR